MRSPVSDHKTQILASIPDRVDLPVISCTYVIGLVVTAIAVLLLPMLYLAVMALLLATLFTNIVQGQYLFAAGILFLIMGLLKPFLARSFSSKKNRPLRRDVEPFLYEYVDRLCDSLGAPRPNTICVTCELNAAAELRKGWLGIFRRRNVSLHIGLPIVAGLSVRQFTGVLSHELGHLTQRIAFGLEAIVRRTNDWLSRAAHERDSIDLWMDQQCAKRSPNAVFCWIARIPIWMTRRVMLGLSFAGSLISGLMSREAEFNADRYEVRVVGPDTFSSTLWRMRILSLAHQGALRDVAAFSSEGRLPDDLIALATANTAFITPKVTRKLRQTVESQTTGLFDSHPSDQDRILAASAEGSRCTFHEKAVSGEYPATVLFGHFEDLCRQVTVQFYQDTFGIVIKPRILHSVEKLLGRQTLQINAARALRRYFQTDIPILRALPLATQSSEPPENAEDTIRELAACRSRMLDHLKNYQRLLLRFRTAEETLAETIAVQTLLQAGLSINPVNDRRKKETSIHATVVADKHSRARAAVACLAGKLLPFESEAGNRLSFAMQLLHVPSVAKQVSRDDDVQYQIQTLLPEAQFVSRLVGQLPSLGFAFHRLAALAERSDEERMNGRVREIIAMQTEALRSRLVVLQSVMGERLYPFDHAEIDAKLKDHVLPEIPEEDDLKGLVEVTEQMKSRLASLQIRLFAVLAQAAEKIEATVGLPTLSEPEEGIV